MLSETYAYFIQFNYQKIRVVLKLLHVSHNLKHELKEITSSSHKTMPEFLHKLVLTVSRLVVPFFFILSIGHHLDSLIKTPLSPLDLNSISKNEVSKIQKIKCQISYYYVWCSQIWRNKAIKKVSEETTSTLFAIVLLKASH